MRAAVIMADQGHVVSVEVYDVLADEFAGRMDKDLAVDADNACYVVIDKTYIMRHDKYCHCPVKLIENCIE